MQIAREELRKLPYLDLEVIGNRFVSIAPYWNGQRWHVWIPNAERLVEMHPQDAMQTNYVAKTPASETDIIVPFVEFMWQQAGGLAADRRVSAICEDFNGLAASAAKVRAAFDNRRSLGPGVAATFVVTEIEYLLTVARSVFDLLQEAISEIWFSRVELEDHAAEVRRKSSRLPATFSKLVLKEKRDLRTAEGIGEKFGLPEALAGEYARQGAFFVGLRESRNDAVHGLTRTPMVFETDRGFCIDPGDRAFRSFTGWTDEHRFNDKLVSIVPWIAHVVLGTIGACGSMVAALAAQVRFPPEMAPGHRVFVRGPNNDALIHLFEVERGGSPWWG